MDYLAQPVDVDYLINTGLLFTINQQILHPFGISLMVKANPDGTKRLDLKDSRTEPEKMIFDGKTYDACHKKYRDFAEKCGFALIDRRQKKLGWGCQYSSPNDTGISS